MLWCWLMVTIKFRCCSISAKEIESQTSRNHLKISFRLSLLPLEFMQSDLSFLDIVLSPKPLKPWRFSSEGMSGGKLVEISETSMIRFINSTERFGLLQWLSSKQSACNIGDAGLIPESGRAPGGGHGNPHQYSCLENLMGREAWRATVHSVAESSSTEVTEHVRTH